MAEPSGSTSGRNDCSKHSLYKKAGQFGTKKRGEVKPSISGISRAKGVKKPLRSKPACPTPGPPLSRTPGGMVTSTPVSTCVGVEAVTKTPSDRSQTDKSISEVGGSQINEEPELELLYARLIQMTYLDVMSAKALKKQESLAKAQLYWLWEEVERKKEEDTHLIEKLVTEMRKMELDKALQVQDTGLEPLSSHLLSVEENYSELMQALDSTTHSMSIRGTLPVSEDALEEELLEVEHVLSEIKSLIKEKLSETCDLSSSVECLGDVLSEEHQELKSCDKEISDLLRTEVRRISYEINKALYQQPELKQ